MDSNVTIPVFAVIGIFLFGVVVGWMMAKVRASASIRVGAPAGIPRGLVPGVRFTKSLNTVRRMTLKCKCGAVWHFAEGISPLPADTQPFPRGDSFVCSKCGKSIDLTQERLLEVQAEAEALRNLNLQSKS